MATRHVETPWTPEVRHGDLFWHQVLVSGVATCCMANVAWKKDNYLHRFESLLFLAIFANDKQLPRIYYVLL